MLFPTFKVENAPPPVDIRKLAPSYGSTIFDARSGMPFNAQPQMPKGIPDVAGPNAVEVKPQDQLTQIVAGFLDQLIGHVVSRVVSEVKSMLPSPTALYQIEQMAIRQFNQEQEAARKELEVYWDERLKAGEANDQPTEAMPGNL